MTNSLVCSLESIDEDEKSEESEEMEIDIKKENEKLVKKLMIEQNPAHDNQISARMSIKSRVRAINAKVDNEMVSYQVNNSNIKKY